MSFEPGSAPAARTLAQMRSGLTRIELAASQLAREAATPAARRLAAGICDAVDELDRAVSETLALLRRADPRSAAREDLRPAFRALAARLGPSLAARGVRVEPQDRGGAPLLGDPRLLRQAAATLLRAGATCCGPERRLRIELVERAGAYGLRLALPGVESLPGGDTGSDQGFEAARSFALRCGGAFAEGPDEGAWRATLWLPRGEDPCSAS